MSEKWKYTVSKNGRHQISNEYGAQVCMLWNCDETIDRANLIAAAPEMRTEIEHLKQVIETLKRQRDDAYASRDLHQMLLQEEITVTNELYEALEQMVNCIHNTRGPDASEALNAAQAALAKARGEY